MKHVTAISMDQFLHPVFQKGAVFAKPTLLATNVQLANQDILGFQIVPRLSPLNPTKLQYLPQPSQLPALLQVCINSTQI